VDIRKEQNSKAVEQDFFPKGAWNRSANKRRLMPTTPQFVRCGGISFSGPYVNACILELQIFRFLNEYSYYEAAHRPRRAPPVVPVRYMSLKQN